MALEIGAATDVGRRRSQNEDHHAVWVPEDPAEAERRGALLVVADGMGGALAGEIASGLAVDTVVATWRADAGALPPAEVLRQAVQAAHASVHADSEAHPDRRGMGTTCTAVSVVGAAVAYAHVGDSRLYHVSAGRITALTRDHSLVAQLLADGHLTEEQARVDPRRNVVTRSVGVGERVEVDAEACPAPLAEGDALVVCSDGLHGVVAEDEIAAAVESQPPGEACRALVALANERGGPDNITVIVARRPHVAGGPRASLARAVDASAPDGVATGGAVAAAPAHLPRGPLVLVAAAVLLALLALALAAARGGRP